MTHTYTGNGTGTIVVPGLDNMISVGATDSTDSRSYFSNYGKESVDIGAPGSSILSPVPQRVDLIQESLLGSSNWKKSVSDTDIHTWTGKLDAS